MRKHDAPRTRQKSNVELNSQSVTQSLRPLQHLGQLVVEVEPGSEEPRGGRTMARHQLGTGVRIQFRLEFLKDKETKRNSDFFFSAEANLKY